MPLIPEDNQAAKELLIEDHRSLSESFWKNEQVGDTRVNLFIGLVTAAVAGLVALTTAKSPPSPKQFRMILIASFFALFVLGIMTLLRVIKRNIVTDGIKQDTAAIHQIFKDHFDSGGILVGYSPYGRKRQSHLSKDAKPHGPLESRAIRRLGGLTHLVASVNSLLFGGLVGSAVFPMENPGNLVTELEATCMAAALAFIGGLILQFWAIDRVEASTRKKLAGFGPTHAGGIVYHVENETVEYLLVGPKQDVPNEWLLPKGHIEEMEGHGEAALREVREETGIVARVIGLVGRVQFVVDKKPVDAKFYLMERLYKTDPNEARRTAWFQYEDALDRITHEQNKALLKRADQLRRQKAS